MSRIGKLPIAIPAGVTVTVSPEYRYPRRCYRYGKPGERSDR